MPVVTHSGLGVARGVRRPSRHLRHRGHVVAGPPDVVPAVVGRVRTLPRSALRRHRGRLLVAAAAAVVWDRLFIGPEGLGEARRRPVHAARSSMLPSEIRRPQLLHRPRQRQAARARHALRDRHRQHAVGHRLPASRRHVAEHARVAVQDVLRHPDRRDPPHARARRGRDLRLRRRQAARRSPTRSARRRPTSVSSARAARPPTSTPAGRR